MRSRSCEVSPRVRYEALKNKIPLRYRCLVPFQVATLCRVLDVPHGTLLPLKITTAAKSDVLPEQIVFFTCCMKTTRNALPKNYNQQGGDPCSIFKALGYLNVPAGKCTSVVNSAACFRPVPFFSRPAASSPAVFYIEPQSEHVINEAKQECIPRRSLYYIFVAVGLGEHLWCIVCSLKG